MWGYKRILSCRKLQRPVALVTVQCRCSSGGSNPKIASVQPLVQRRRATHNQVTVLIKKTNLRVIFPITPTRLILYSCVCAYGKRHPCICCQFDFSFSASYGVVCAILNTLGFPIFTLSWRRGVDCTKTWPLAVHTVRSLRVPLWGFPADLPFRAPRSTAIADFYFSIGQPEAFFCFRRISRPGLSHPPAVALPVFRLSQH